MAWSATGVPSAAASPRRPDGVVIERMNRRVSASNRVRSVRIRQAPPGRPADRRRWPRSRRAAAVIGIAAVAVAAVAAFLVADGGSDAGGPRPLTTDEAGQLAITRFRNYQAQGRAVTITVPGTAAWADCDRVRRLSAQGRLRRGARHWARQVQRRADPVDARLGARPPDDGRPGARARVAAPFGLVRPSAAVVRQRAGHLPDHRARSRRRPAGQRRTAAAEWRRLVGAGAGGRALGGRHDRTVLPDRTGTAGNVRYWIGSDGTMYRVRVSVGSQPEPVVIVFDTHKYVPVKPVPGTTPTR